MSTPVKVSKAYRPPSPLSIALALLALLVLALGGPLLRPSLATPGTWSFVGSLGVDRDSHTATLLPDGKVLLVGGRISGQTNSAQLYDPVTRIFSPTGGMATARAGHTATFLTTGEVLVTGGYDENFKQLANAEIYDPTCGGFIPTKGPMSTEREDHIASLLLNGQVLIAGGWNDHIGFLNSAEIYDPINQTFTPTKGLMVSGQCSAAAVTLLDGRVLIVGGDDASSDFATGRAQIYDPVSGTFSSTAVGLYFGRKFHTATLLPNGKVLVAGGRCTPDLYANIAELYDPVTNKFSWTDSMYGVEQHTATLLANGQVMVAGGQDDVSPYSKKIAQLYDPATGTFARTADMGLIRSYHTATRLLNGQVIAAGGNSLLIQPPDFRAELYEPVPPPIGPMPPLLAFFPFEGNTLDASGNGHHGIPMGYAHLAAGFEGQGYNFNGLNDYIVVELDINPVNYPKLTMGGWARTVSGWPAQQFLTHDNGDFDRSIGIDFRGNGIGWSAFCGPAGQVLGARPAFFGTWTFVAAVYDQIHQTVSLQVDDYTITKTGVILGPGQNTLFIGASPQFGSFFAGDVDNIFVYGGALTPQQLNYIRGGGAQAILPATKHVNPALLLLLMD